MTAFARAATKTNEGAKMHAGRVRRNGCERGRRPRRAIHALVAVGTAIAALLASAPAASATAYELSGTFAGGPGSGSMELDVPGRADVRESDGLLFVADSANDRVQVFEPAGGSATFVQSLSHPDLSAPLGVAVDQSDGSVYVSGADGVLKFDSGLDPVGSFGPVAATGSLAVDPTTGDLLVADPAANEVSRFTPAGVPFGAPFDGSDGSTAFTGLEDIAVTSAGDIYVVDVTGDIAQGVGTSSAKRYTAAGMYVSTLVAPLILGQPNRVARIDVAVGDDDQVALSGRQDAMQADQVPTFYTYDDAGTLLQSFTLPASGGATYSKIANVSHDETRSRLYVTHDRNYYAGDGQSYGSGPGIVVYAAIQTPEIVSGPVVDDVTGTGAAVTVELEPNGLAAAWLVEYSDDGGDSWVEVGAGTLPASSGSVAVTATLADLEPRTGYLVRLRIPAYGVSSTVISFETAGAPPRVRVMQRAARVSDTSVRLLGAVDPQGADTRYWYEYGTTPAYGSRVPAAPGAPVGAGNDWESAIETLTGLRPDTVYHYRLVAESADGLTAGADHTFSTAAPAPIADDCPNAAVRRQQGTSWLANCRAYEMVSPVRKFNGGVAAGQRVSDDGEAAGYVLNAATGAQDGAYPTTPYVSRRTPDGWVAASGAPPIRSEHRGSAEVNVAARDFSDDFSKVYIRTSDPIDPADLEPMYSGGLGPAFGFDIYAFEPFTRSATWVSRPEPAVAAAYKAGTTTEYYGRSDDGRHVVIGAHLPLVAEAPILPTTSQYSLYDIADGEPKLVSVLPNGDPSPTGGRVPRPTYGIDMMRPDGTEAISDDGRRIYWTPAGDAREPLYLREDGQPTIAVSRSQATATAGQITDATFMAASDDGAVVYFHSLATVPLVDGAPASEGIYRWERDGERLAFVAPATSVVASVGTLTWGSVPLATSAGDRLYFMSTSTLAPGAIAGRHNLYVWDEAEGGLTTIAATSSSGPTLDLRLLMSSSGRYVVYTSRDSLGPGHRDGVNEIYLYDAATGDSECASCRRDGPPSTTDALLREPSLRYGGLVQPTVQVPRNVSDNGQVFFNTDEALVARDSNDDTDVYEYVDGQINLISSGQGDGGRLVDNSDDGTSVFFTTTNAHTARDIDGGYPDVYVARVGGGFPEPPAPPAPCSGAGCREGIDGPPGGPSIGSADSRGPDRQAAGGQATLSVAAARSVRGQRVVVRVRVPAAGRVAVRSGAVRNVVRRARRAGVLRLAVRLSPAARRKLARRGRLRVTLRVVYARPGTRTAARRVAVTFERPKAKAGRGR